LYVVYAKACLSTLRLLSLIVRSPIYISHMVCDY
jgi:hypothetical protein